jgi:hypothetical protein
MIRAHQGHRKNVGVVTVIGGAPADRMKLVILRIPLSTIAVGKLSGRLKVEI